MYAEGGRSRSEELGKPRPGIGRLALESGAPVVPLAICGTAGVRDWRKFHFPKVTVKYGDPIQFERDPSPTLEQAQAVAEAIFGQIKELYYGLANTGRREAVRAARSARRRGRTAQQRAATG